MLASDLSRLFLDGLVLGAFLVLPLLAATLATGALSGLIQRLARVNEPVIGLIPRLVGVGIAALLLAPWWAAHMASFTRRIWALLATVGG